MSETTHEIVRTISVDAAPQQVWNLVGDFGGIHRWNSLVTQPQLVPDAPAEPGTVRVFGAGTPDEFKEQLVLRDDEHRTITYAMTEPPFPISGHRATMAVIEEGTGSLVRWGATFLSTDKVAHQLESVLGDGVFAPGLASLRATLG